MTPSDIGLITQAVELRVSPDGARVAFTVVSVDLDANTYRSRIWMASSDGSSPAYPFTAGDGRDGLPRWSPDGRRLAFTTREGRPTGIRRDSTASRVEIVVMPVTVGGQMVRVAAQDEEISELEWSPDGTPAGVCRSGPRPVALRHPGPAHRGKRDAATTDRPSAVPGGYGRMDRGPAQPDLRRDGRRFEAGSGPDGGAFRCFGSELGAGWPSPGLRVGSPRAVGPRPGQRRVADQP